MAVQKMDRLGHYSSLANGLITAVLLVSLLVWCFGDVRWRWWPVIIGLSIPLFILSAIGMNISSLGGNSVRHIWLLWSYKVSYPNKGLLNDMYLARWFKEQNIECRFSKYKPVIRFRRKKDAMFFKLTWC
jgi:hypothetical protein